jgi:hypothetical protein
MKHAKAFAIKGIMTLAVLSIVLSLGFRISAESVTIIVILFGAISYGAGDLAVLHKTNNFIATAADLATAFLLVWTVVMWYEGLEGEIAASSAFISALLIAVGEYFFHFYIFREKLGAVEDESINIS